MITRNEVIYYALSKAGKQIRFCALNKGTAASEADPYDENQSNYIILFR